jgi:hypothetical protein
MFLTRAIPDEGRVANTASSAVLEAFGGVRNKARRSRLRDDAPDMLLLS